MPVFANSIHLVIEALVKEAQSVKEKNVMLPQADGAVDAGIEKHEILDRHIFTVTGLETPRMEPEKSPNGPGAAQVDAADFETAIAATGYGRFNIALMLCTMPAFWSAVSVTSSVSFIFTRAKCDMDLSLLDMGTINAITYGGMISSAMLWGFLSDTLGRRRIMIWGFLFSGVLELLAAISQNFAMLLVTRFMAGFLFNGPFAVLISYIAELHRTELRARVMLYTCLFYTMANSTLPLLAWGILSHDWDIQLFGGSFVMRTWNLFLATTGLIPLFTGVAFCCLPESPKFLMSRGRNEEALVIFRKIFSANTGKLPEDYPIKTLIAEKSEECSKGAAALRDGFQQLAPLFQPPNLFWLAIICTIHSGAMFGSNTLRLWFPQLAAMIEAEAGKGLCDSIEASTYSAPPLLPEEIETCKPIIAGAGTYLQSVAVGSASVLTYGLGGLLVNKCGKKNVAGCCLLACAITSIVIPVLGNGPMAVVILIATFLAITSLAGAALSSIMVDLFPTSLRVMAVATFLMCGRLGTITGNVTFPALLEFGCLPPFLTITSVMAAGGLACFLLPNTTLKKLE